jgi:Ser/Thr protein kinase RdoA (MazF antagonist)
MTTFDKMTSEEQIASLAECVDSILGQYDLGQVETESINHEYNSTFKVTAESGAKYALRVNINSGRSLENLLAEVFWVSNIKDVLVPKPVANSTGEFVSTGWHEATGKHLNAVLYTWLEGSEPGDEPSTEALFAAGAAMAKLHESARDLVLPADAALPDYSGFFWGWKGLLLSEESELDDSEKALVAKAKAAVEGALAELSKSDSPRPIHADIHPWNMMWHEGEIAIFDFDDSGVGLPVQDLATSLYYLDTEEQDQAFLAGYASVRALPVYSDVQMKLLLLQRRLLLLDYLYETSTPEHKAMIPAYKEESMRRVEALLGSGS